MGRWSGALWVVAVVLLVGGAHVRAESSPVKLLLSSLEKQYGKERADEVFKSVVDALEGKGGAMMGSVDPTEVVKLVEQKIDELKERVNDPGLRAGRSEEADELVHEVKQMTIDLSDALKQDQTGQGMIKLAEQMQETLTAVTKLGNKVKSDISQAENLLNRLGRLTIKMRDKQDQLKRTTRTVYSKVERGSTTGRWRSLMYFVFIVELLLLALYAAAQKFVSTKKYNKLG
mmetsp:Transcript_9747/g.29618  ORF Transcript_9747/g.29618 Transcript_9747/m.29618 type:complete len:231 (+) Transcript_9747:350-1042(+)|eukprot:CAMPEP_0198737506 /NCGR_PEP_ID=MMETSP1475-20131203/67895_1 /TAXON_ID= ORGANISM="Unidentified sp., Strain CCMP1999" /NCGR_SAMPLE_ID=MMETSP1475 /ASSEMBLY_ACC=CAM_ASM_001111 /LENGTH=230 /DNA_ID=CAMNT_0044501373 /DNA_START=1738 /DNA_END=2430 /DNA_ORIENTATION=-